MAVVWLSGKIGQIFFTQVFTRVVKKEWLGICPGYPGLHQVE